MRERGSGNVRQMSADAASIISVAQNYFLFLCRVKLEMSQFDPSVKTLSFICKLKSCFWCTHTPTLQTHTRVHLFWRGDLGPKGGKSHRTDSVTRFVEN